jgi:superfamily II DNA or RNA helicase
VSNFGVFIEQLNQDYPDVQPRGKAFERACKWLLTHDPYYSQEFKNVWLWDEWPRRWGPDIGIDIVAESFDGGLIAVQAKCYASTVPSQEIDSFIAASSRSEFAGRLLIATSDITNNAETKLSHQDKPSPYLLGSALGARPVDWLASIDETRPALPEPKTPFLYQQTIIDDVIRGFGNADRGKVIMACGTGKTLVGLWSAEGVSAQRSLVLVPSLSLVDQISREWQENASTPFKSLFVCSDASVASDAFVGNVYELGVRVTTDPEQIKTFLSGDGRRVVFATYQSSLRIAEAQALGAPRFDLTIADEAHHCTGKVESHFAAVLDDARLQSDKRLFMTATPRIISKRIKDQAGDLDFEIASMDNEEDFGRNFHVLTFGEAIAGDLLSDYRVVILGVSEGDTRKLIDKRTLVELERSGFRTDAETLAKMGGLARTINQYDLSHLITFHTTVKGASDFSNGFSSLLNVLPTQHRLKREHWSGHISGKMTGGARRTLLSTFRELTDDQVGVLSNARCLNEGVDVPAIDCIVFLDPKRSKTDIVQAVGRAIRKSGKGKVGTILIPVFLNESEDPEEALADSRFEPVWAVLQALRDHDDILAEELDALRYALGRRGTIGGKLPGKIIINIPTHVGGEFLSALETRLVEATTASWEAFFGLLEEYKEANGHCNVPQSAGSLGTWVEKQRGRKSQLSDERIARLDAIGFEWDPLAAALEESFAALLAFKEANGHCNVPRNAGSLGNWVINQRARKNQLSDERIARFDAIGFVWDHGDAILEESFAALLAYKEANGHCNVPARPTSLGMWVSNQRLARNRNQLSQERIDRFNAIGFVWDPFPAAWEESFAALLVYKEANGHCNVPQSAGSLGSWVNNTRSARPKNRLSQERIARLDAIGFVWDPWGVAWDESFAALLVYKEANGHCNVPRSAGSLGKWISKQRNNNQLSQERIQPRK